jgi:hypothetical protein
MKCLYMALMGLDPTGRGRGRWVIRWLSRHGARWRYCYRSVSPCRSPNPPCASRRNGLSTVAAVQAWRGVVQGLGIRSPRYR